MERKSFPFELEEKGLDPEARTFQGYAAVMGNVDEGNDEIVKGAFKKTIKEMGDRVKVFFIHDFMQPIGKPLELKEVPRGKLPQKLLERAPSATGGLYVKAYISDTTLGNDTLTLMKDMVLDELSIGYDAIKHEMKEGEDGEESIRLLREIKLYDISPVPLGMNPAAMITSVKKWLDTLGDDDKIEVTENYIRIPISEGHGGHRIRTITISANQGIKALYCGECKKVITYLFDKDKWTVARAKEWVKEHSKSLPWDKLEEAMERQDKELEEIIEGKGEPTGGFLTFDCDQEVQQKVIDAFKQHAEIQKQQIEEL